MRPSEARSLQIDDRIFWNANPSDAGTIQAIGAFTILIVWDNSPSGLLHVDNCERLSLGLRACAATLRGIR
jgi:hypothetical protein